MTRSANTVRRTRPLRWMPRIYKWDYSYSCLVLGIRRYNPAIMYMRVWTTIIYKSLRGAESREKVNCTARTCTAILCNSWGETFAAKVPALWTVCTTFPKLARNISIQWPHTWLTTIYTRSWAALRGWDLPPYDRSSVFSDPWLTGRNMVHPCCSWRPSSGKGAWLLLKVDKNYFRGNRQNRLRSTLCTVFNTTYADYYYKAIR